MLEFGALLRVYRTHWKLTQAEMAEFLSVSQPVYSRMEAGLRPVSFKTLQRVADRLEISVWTLVLAHFFLDENLAAIEKNRSNGAVKTLLLLAEDYRKNAPPHLKDAAAVALLFNSGGDRTHVGPAE